MNSMYTILKQAKPIANIATVRRHRRQLNNIRSEMFKLLKYIREQIEEDKLHTHWIAVEDSLPKVDEFYFVWVPEWEGYGNEAHGDIAWWDGSHWSDGNFPSIEDGAYVSHWAHITEPR